jgi:type II secretory pathway pseudopilin PulG
MVISIIALLAGLLFGGIVRVRQTDNIHATKIMVKSLEAGFRQYYNEYGQWPSAFSDGSINATITGILQGTNNAAGANSRFIQFLDVGNRATYSDGTLKPPFTSATAPGPTFYCRFYRGTTPLSPPDGSGTVSAPVIVWAYNPYASPSSSSYYIGSWN